MKTKLSSFLIVLALLSGSITVLHKAHASSALPARRNSHHSDPGRWHAGVTRAGGHELYRPDGHLPGWRSQLVDYVQLPVTDAVNVNRIIDPTARRHGADSRREFTMGNCMDPTRATPTNYLCTPFMSRPFTWTSMT